MTAKLRQLIETTAETIVAANKNCFFDATAIKNTKQHLTAFAEKIVGEVEPTPPTPPTP